MNTFKTFPNFNSVETHYSTSNVLKSKKRRILLWMSETPTNANVISSEDTFTEEEFLSQQQSEYWQSYLVNKHYIILLLIHWFLYNILHIIFYSMPTRG
jgi:hypothetical protein